jgi:hypothetical protein
MANYEEFMDPNSAIARIIAQMQGAADRSNPGPGPGMPGDLPVNSVPQPGGAQPGPVGAGPGMNEVMGPPEDLESMGYMRNGQDPFGGIASRDPQQLIQMLLGGMSRR